jgi:hypothetical protein
VKVSSVNMAKWAKGVGSNVARLSGFEKTVVSISNSTLRTSSYARGLTSSLKSLEASASIIMISILRAHLINFLLELCAL